MNICLLLAWILSAELLVINLIDLGLCQPLLWDQPALFNPKTSILIQKRHPYTGKLSSETSGDSKNAFLHCGDVLDRYQVCLTPIQKCMQQAYFCDPRVCSQCGKHSAACLLGTTLYLLKPPSIQRPSSKETGIKPLTKSPRGKPFKP